MHTDRERYNYELAAFGTSPDNHYCGYSWLACGACIKCARRDRRNKQRDIRVQYLIEAYRHLESGTCRGPIHGTEFAAPFESAIVDIQFFGSPDQVRMAKELTIAIASKHPDVSAGSLLMSLRDDLREELDLE
ncbi:hypothetical protein JXA32_12340 [Candidatus Sumerlaeota bacterium]|nr:hypothetical protein [Candidatus Sumerlaeota bacterium]